MINFDPKNSPNETFFHILRTDYGLTQGDIAELANVTRMSVARTEQLNYPEPLPAVATALSVSTERPLNELEFAYRMDVLRRREYTSKVLYPPINDIDNVYIDTMLSTLTFKDWRTFRAIHLGLPTSVIKFSAMICVHPDIITNYERRQAVTRNTSIPVSLAVAFKEMGYPSTFLTNYIGGLSL